MAKNYANALPIDEMGASMQGYPAPKIALATTVTVAGQSSLISLNPNTTEIEVAAPNQAAAIKWIGVAAAQTSVISSYFSAANFDHIVPAATYRRFVLPQETQGNAGPAQAGSMFGLYQRLAVVPVATGTASILVTEY